jgi:phosphoserine aminotransferase
MPKNNLRRFSQGKYRMRSELAIARLEHRYAQSRSAVLEAIAELRRLIDIIAKYVILLAS